MSDIKLSVCMMVKNEEENLNRCLLSIKNTCSREDVELIIVDTGSTDLTVEIAKNFTDKVYYHEWKDNFSDMRNISISYAKGEWILILDADEEFYNEEKLIELLESNKIEPFNTAQITLRNFTKINKNTFSQIPTLRFFRDKGFRYQGAVHNQPVYKNPVYYATEIILNHYGYNNDDRNLMTKKYERTKTLLLKELKKQPNNIYYLYQLSQTYYMYGERNKSYDAIKKAFSLLKTKAEKEKYIYIFEKYSNICITLEKYIEAEKITDDGININSEYLDLYFINVVSKIKTGRIVEAIPYIKIYLSLFNELENLEIVKNPSIELFRVSQNDENMMVAELVNYYLERREYIDAYKYLNKLNDEQRKNKLMIIYSFAKKDFESLFQYYTKLEKDIFVFQQLMENQLSTLNEFDKVLFYQIFAHGNDEYAQFNQLRSANKHDHIGILKSLEYKLDFNALPCFYLQTLEKTFYDNPNRFFHLLKKVQSSMIRELISTFFIPNISLKKQLLTLINSREVRDSDIQGNRVYYVISSMLLIDVAANDETDENYKLYKNYIQSGVQYVMSLYNLKTLRLVYKTIDEKEIKFMLIYSLVSELTKNNDYKGVLRLYKEALDIFPVFSKYIEQDILYLKESTVNNLS
jgi:glycosyltransferase involved in cell wall biosynthesis